MLRESSAPGAEAGDEAQELARAQDVVRGRYPYRLATRNLTLYFEGKKLAVQSFEEAMRDLSIAKERVSACELELECGGVSASLRFTKYIYARLDVKVSPEGLTESREIFASLSQWVDSIRAPRWIRLWHAWRGAQWFVWFMLALIGLSFAVHRNDELPWAHKEKARTLLAAGIRQDNQYEAIAAALALIAEYEKPEPARELRAWVLWVLGAGAIIAIALQFCPGLVMEIGSGVRSYRRWQIWVRFIEYTVPVTLVSSVLLPYVVEWLRNL